MLEDRDERMKKRDSVEDVQTIAKEEVSEGCTLEGREETCVHRSYEV